MQKILIFSIIILSLIVNQVSAELIIQSPINISTKINQLTQFNMTIKNNFTFNITDFTFSNLTGFTFPSLFLIPGEEKTFVFNVSISQAMSQSINSVVSFKYFVEIPNSQKTFEVNITDQGYNPSFLIIHQGDTVIWKNKDDITHTVTGSFFDFDLEVNGSAQQVFNNIESYDYQDMVLFYGGTINVLDKNSQQKANNPNYNKNIVFDMNIISEPTTIKLENIGKQYYSIEANRNKTGGIKISNNGTNQASKIHLSSSSSWIKFSKNDFNLDTNLESFIEYDIMPFMLDTNETDKNYTINIFAKAGNSNQDNFSINIFVPYRDISSNTQDPAYVLRLIEEFCNRNPNNAFCSPPNASSNPQIIVRDPQVNINTTYSQFYNMLKTQQKTADTIERQGNTINDISEFIQNSNNENKEINNKTGNEVKEMKNTINSIWNVFWIILIFVIIGIIFTSLFKIYEKYRFKKSIEAGIGK
jgi:plastocyanin